MDHLDKELANDTSVSTAAGEHQSTGTAGFAAPPLQFHDGEHEHNHEHGEEHDHDHDIDTSNSNPTDPSAIADPRGNIGGLQDKNDKSGQEIEDGEPSFIQSILKRLFLARGQYGPIRQTSPTTNIGGFSATYNTGAQLLDINTDCKYDFHNGLTINNAGTVVVNPSGYSSKDARLTNAANTANTTMTPVQRAAFVQQFTWTIPEIIMGMLQLNQQLSIASDLWSYQHSFYINKEGWKDIRARVRVNLNGSLGAPTAGSDHLRIRMVKTPPNSAASGSAAAVSTAGNVQNNVNQMTLDSSKLTGLNNFNFLQRSVTFDNDSDEISADQQTFLTQLIATHQDDNQRLLNDGNAANDSVSNNVLNEFKLVGHASSSGSDSHNADLAERRVDAVKTFLEDNGLHHSNSRIKTDNQGETGASDDASWRRVDIIIGSGEAQHTIAHEFGHVFGLRDEYATGNNSLISGTGSPAGTQVGHDQLSTSLGADNATAENNDGIMSLGNEVRPQHYSTFGEALRTATGVPEWMLVT